MKAETGFVGEPVAFAVDEPPAVRALLEGRARIAKGWCQHELSIVRPDCLGGVAYCAVGASLGSFGGFEYLIQALPTGKWVAAYNDAPERTQADILALYDRAIALARAA